MAVLAAVTIETHREGGPARESLSGSGFFGSSSLLLKIVLLLFPAGDKNPKATGKNNGNDCACENIVTLQGCDQTRSHS